MSHGIPKKVFQNGAIGSLTGTGVGYNVDDKNFRNVTKYGSPGDPAAWARMLNAKQSQGVMNAAQQANDYRLGVAGNINDIATSRRASFDQNYQPVFDSLTNEVSHGYEPDYNAISDQAKQDIANAYGRARQVTAQRAAMYGAPQVTNQQDTNANQLAQTADEAYASNSAMDQARLRAQNLEATRPQQVMQLGLGVPGSAATGYRIGGGTISNIMDRGVAGDYNAFQDKLGMEQGIASGIGNIAGSLTGGGMGFADGGVIPGGGNARHLIGPLGDLVRLKQKYDEAVGRGETDKPFKQWVTDQSKIPPPAPRGIPGPATPPSMTAHSDHPMPMMPAGPDNEQPVITTGGKYADGGSVDLKSGDVIIPADVVTKFGPDFFDVLVARHGG